MKKVLFLLLSFCALTSVSAQSSMHRRVENMLSQMTVDEKLSLMVHQNPAIDRLGLPAYSWWNEALHGVARYGKAEVYPMPVALAATFDPQLVESIFANIRQEALSKHLQALRDSNYRGDYTGLTFFTPNINLFRDPRWGRGMETYGEDPYLTAVMGLAVVRGLQGPAPHDTATNVNHHIPLVGACVKHFAVHSGPEGIRHEIDVQASMRDIWTSYLPAFEYIVKRGNPMQVMGGYNRLNGVPLCTNNWLMHDILRQQWHYDGIIVTDCWALNDCWERDTVIPRHKTHPTAATAARDAFGMEVDLECGSGLPALRTAIDSGYISIDKVDDHLRRILPVRLQILDYEQHHKESPIFRDIDPSLALEASARSLVLLKNDGVLPLKNYRVAVVGPNSNDSAMALGNYNGEPYLMTTIWKGFRDVHTQQLHLDEDLTQYADQLSRRQRRIFRKKMADDQDAFLFQDKACNLVSDDYKLPSDFWHNIEHVDQVVFVGGLSPELEGEELQVKLPGFDKGDRTTIELPEVQRKMIHEIKRRTGKPIVLVLCTGSAIALENVMDDVDAVVVAWYGGQDMGRAVANALYGYSDFGGRLPVTFYRSTKQLPPFDDYSMDGRTYRYLDCVEAMGPRQKEPLFPFGYGLGYGNLKLRESHFDATHLRLSGVIANEAERQVNCNSVLQVYLTNLDDPKGPHKQLVAVHNSVLQPNSTQSFDLTIDPFWMRVFDTAKQQLTAPKQGSHYRLHVGWSSADADLKTFDFTY